MKFLKHIRSKSRIQQVHSSDHDASKAFSSLQIGDGRDHSARIPDKVLRRILIFVCPHTQDITYTTCENSGTEDGCMLCDSRDLAQCARVCKRWNLLAQDLLYSSVRIDAVHYCEREIKLSALRKTKSWNRNAVPIDAPAQTLKLFSRTVWAEKSLATMVHSVKVAYMTRESCKADLARCISVLPNLCYVDLPEGVFSDDPACGMLKQELQAQCPDIRKMKYSSGSEPSFSAIPYTRQWQNLEMLELASINLEPTILLRVLHTFSLLRELTITDMPFLDDSLFKPNPSLPPFPPLQKLTLENISNVTAAGLASYLSQVPNSEALSSLSLTNTGVLPQTLHHILSRAPYLATLNVVEDVSRSFPVEPIPYLQSHSLHTVNFEITANNTPAGFQSPASSYYAYLRNSIQNNTLPNLRALYVRDGHFPEDLVLAPPQPAFSDNAGYPIGFTQPLSIYSKGLDELEWNFTAVSPPTEPGRRGSSSATRPVSAFSAHLGPAWGGSARKSIIVGNGFGGFLAVPTEEGTRSAGLLGSESSPKFSVDKRDLWR